MRVRRKFSGFSVSFAVILLSMSLAGCDLFSTRSPDPPTAGNTFIWTSATSISVLIENFKGALAVVDAANFVKTMVAPTDSLSGGGTTPYQFFPRSGVDKTQFNGWNVESERSALTKLGSLLPKDPRITVVLSNLQINQSNASSGTVDAHYSLLLPVDPASGIPSSVSGSLHFQVELVTTEQATKEWRIVSWTDIASTQTTEISWTDLKLKLL
jgi:hypothetical protein